MQQFLDWYKTYSINVAGDMFTVLQSCAYFEKELWFELVNIMWRKHVKYIHNDIFNPFRAGNLQYAARVCEVHNLAKYLPPPSIKGRE